MEWRTITQIFSSSSRRKLEVDSRNALDVLETVMIYSGQLIEKICQRRGWRCNQGELNLKHAKVSYSLFKDNGETATIEFLITLTNEPELSFLVIGADNREMISLGKFTFVGFEKNIEKILRENSKEIEHSILRIFID